MTIAIPIAPGPRAAAAPRLDGSGSLPGLAANDRYIPTHLSVDERFLPEQQQDAALRRMGYEPVGLSSVRFEKDAYGVVVTDFLRAVHALKPILRFNSAARTSIYGGLFMPMQAAAQAVAPSLVAALDNTDPRKAELEALVRSRHYHVEMVPLGVRDNKDGTYFYSMRVYIRPLILRSDGPPADARAGIPASLA
jgi:hypothetical protein